MRGLSVINRSGEFRGWERRLGLPTRLSFAPPRGGVFVFLRCSSLLSFVLAGAMYLSFGYEFVCCDPSWCCSLACTRAIRIRHSDQSDQPLFYSTKLNAVYVLCKRLRLYSDIILAIQRLVEAHAARVLHKFASSAAPPQCNQQVGGVAPIVRAQHATNSFGRLLRIVKGNTRHEVVGDMRLDDAVQDVLPDEPKVAVDGSRCAAWKGPHVGCVMGEGWVGMLEVGDGDQPMVHPHIGQTIV